MSVLYQTGKLCLYRKSLNISFSKYLGVRTRSDVSRKFRTFDDVVAQRKAEARRSLIVQVNSETSFNELYGYCSKYATVNDVFHYKNSTDEHFMLIEFETEDNLQEVLSTCGSHQKDLDVMAIRSPFLWFRAAAGTKENYGTPPKNLAIVEGTKLIDNDKLFEELLNCETVSDQLQLLYNSTKLNDIGIRLRFMVARQLEVILKSLYANICVQPFGSSVNGMGKMGCDLDLVLTNTLTDEMCSPNRRLVYQEKKCEGGRSPWQRHMECVGALLELRAPAAARVQRILNARVPIVKYFHDITDLECDLCYNNTSGVYMSELLWVVGELDPRVRPLTFAVRRWARTVGLTNVHPGRWITNFPLTLMVIFFLQNQRILPTLKNLAKRAGKEDLRIAEENLNCTFLRDMNKLPPNEYSQNADNLETLLLQFFEFYAQFDFQEKAISINEGKPVRKPNSLPLYIVNPLEQALNVSRNVSYEECERLRMEVRNAAWQLETGLEGKKSEDWGLLSLIETRSTRGLKKLLRVGNSHRLVSVKDLFGNDKDDEKPMDGLRSKLQKYNKTDKDSVSETKRTVNEEKKEQNIKFKNTQVRNEVYRIRRDKIV